MPALFKIGRPQRVAPTSHMQEKIIQFLKNTDGYISGEDMSQQLQVSRAAIWKYIDQLRQEGYEITAVPHLGYKLEAAPDKLLAHEVQFNLKTKIIGRRIVSLDTVASTMDEAFRLGMEGAVEGTVVCAEGQSQGRGRLGRGWASPKGKGIYASLILRPKLPPTQMSQLTLMTAVALAQAVHKTTILQPSIKWPNDLMVGSKKLAGILTELRAETDQVKFVIVGIGLNVNALSSQLLDTATSLKIELGETVHRVELFQEILRFMEFWYARVHKGRFDQVLDYCKKYSATINKRVRIHDQSGDTQGLATGIDSDGGILIRRDNGSIVKKMSGDITQLR